MSEGVGRYRTRSGAEIYRIPIEAYPGIRGYVHVVSLDGILALIDVGPGTEKSNLQLEKGLSTIREEYGEPIQWGDFTHVLITHGHIDHYGGLKYLRRHSVAAVGIHELDLPVLANCRERLRKFSKKMGVFLAETCNEEITLNGKVAPTDPVKWIREPIAPDFTYGACGMQVHRMHIQHVPGHSPGHVLIQLDEVLISGDHLFDHLSPLPSMESLIYRRSLGHYLESLERTQALEGETQLTLGSHSTPFEDLSRRIATLKGRYLERLRRIVDFLHTPNTLRNVAAMLFPGAEDFMQLRGLVEAEACLEFLAQRGFISIEQTCGCSPDDHGVLRYHRMDSDVVESALLPVLVENVFI